MSRLADIYKSEKKSGGGFTSTLGKRVLEKMDPRQFFDQSGLMAAFAPGIFKKYSATSDKKIGSSLNNVRGIETVQNFNSSELKDIQITSKISAKNSMVLPTMARDMNVTRLNIQKLVKLSGATPTKSADMFFKRASEREAAYESRFKKEGGTSTKPTMVKETKESKSIFSFLSDILSLFVKGGLIAALVAGAGKLLENPEIRKVVGDGLVEIFSGIMNFFKGGFKILGDVVDNPKFEESIKELFVAMKEFFVKIFEKIDKMITDELGVGLLPALAIGGALYLAITALGAALGGLAVAAGTAAALWAASKLGLPVPGGPQPGKTTGAPGGAGAPGPGKPPVGLPKQTIPPGTIGEKVKPGFLKSAVEKIQEKEAIRAMGQKGAEQTAKRVTQRLLAGALGGPWATAFLIYEVADALAPEDTEALEENIAILSSLQDDMDEAKQNLLAGKITPEAYRKVETSNNIKAKNIEAKMSALKSIIIKRYESEGKDTSELPFVKNDNANETQRLLSKNTAPANLTPATSTPSVTSTLPAVSTTPTQISSTNYNETVAKTESGGKYDTVYGKAGGAVINGKPVTQNTIGEVIEWQKKNRASNRHAAGKYQFINVEDAAKNAGLSADALFDAVNQEIMQKAFTERNAKSLERRGVEATNENLALAHAVGAGGAAALLKAQKSGQGNLLAADVLGLKDSSRTTNPQLMRPVSEVISASNSRFASSTVTPAPMAPVTLAAAAPTRPSSIISDSTVALAEVKERTSSAPIVVNAPQTVNNMQQGSQAVTQYTAPSIVDSEFMRMLVSRAV